MRQRHSEHPSSGFAPGSTESVFACGSNEDVPRPLPATGLPGGERRSPPGVISPPGGRPGSRGRSRSGGSRPRPGGSGGGRGPWRRGAGCPRRPASVMKPLRSEWPAKASAGQPAAAARGESAPLRFPPAVDRAEERPVRDPGGLGPGHRGRAPPAPGPGAPRRPRPARSSSPPSRRGSPPGHPPGPRCGPGRSPSAGVRRRRSRRGGAPESIRPPDELEATARLPTEAHHLVVAVGDRERAFFEKGPPQGLGLQRVESILFVPADRIDELMGRAEICDSGE